jgi:hypothetical protein
VGCRRRHEISPRLSYRSVDEGAGRGGCDAKGSEGKCRGSTHGSREGLGEGTMCNWLPA